MNTMKLQMDFHQQDEVSVFIESNAVGQLQPFGEILLFSVLALRQLHNLGVGSASKALSDGLALVRTDPSQFLSTDPPDAPRLVDYRGSPGRKRFLATLEYEADRAKFFLEPKGFGVLGQGVNYYAPHSVLVLFRFLAHKHSDDAAYNANIAQAAGLASTVFDQGKVTPFTQTGLAVGIARVALGYPV